MEKIFLILGSNMGDRQGYIKKALELIALRAGNILKRSAVYETEPWGFHADQNFLNQAILIESRLSALELLHVFKAIENELGRVKNAARYGSRCIDIDILFFGEQVIAFPELSIPHREMQHRKFVLVPLSEIAGETKHPLLGIDVNEMLTICTDPCMVKKFKE